MLLEREFSGALKLSHKERKRHERGDNRDIRLMWDPRISLFHCRGVSTATVGLLSECMSGPAVKYAYVIIAEDKNFLFYFVLVCRQKKRREDIVVFNLGQSGLTDWMDLGSLSLWALFSLFQLFFHVLFTGSPLLLLPYLQLLVFANSHSSSNSSFQKWDLKNILIL